MYKIVKTAGGVQENADKAEVMIQSADDLEDLPEQLAPGSVAYKADMSLIYMKDVDGTWTQIGA